MPKRVKKCEEETAIKAGLYRSDSSHPHMSVVANNSVQHSSSENLSLSDGNYCFFTL